MKEGVWGPVGFEEGKRKKRGGSIKRTDCGPGMKKWGWFVKNSDLCHAAKRAAKNAGKADAEAMKDGALWVNEKRNDEPLPAGKIQAREGKHLAS